MERYLLPWNKEGMKVFQTEVLVLGSGIAGLYTAIKASPDFAVTVLTKKNIKESNTEHAQGGIAAALDEADSPALHYEDTLQAGAGLCDAQAVRILVEEGPARVEEMIAMGARFDMHDGTLAFTREGAHSRRRILHAMGDATGWEIERTLVEKVKSIPKIQVLEDRFLLDLLEDENGIAGALVFNTVTSELESYLAKAVVLATGGLGQMFLYTTNPEVATGDGIAAAFRAGADLMDMEFVQFHPTSLQLPNAPHFLISEAVRGEGAHLLNWAGKRFMETIPGQELAPRDVVARAIWQELNQGPVYLDFRPIGKPKIEARFPKILQTCRNYGVDALTEPVPVAPAAHYMMGGIRTNIFGETSLSGLYACGECSCNGVHGANRLASNSLLDGLVYGARIVERIKEGSKTGMPKWENVKPYKSQVEFSADSLKPKGENFAEQAQDGVTLRDVQNMMWENVGIIREHEGLQEILKVFSRLDQQYSAEVESKSLELGNLLTVGSLVAEAALERTESRGGHYRKDYPEPAPTGPGHSVFNKGDRHVSYVPV